MAELISVRPENKLLLFIKKWLPILTLGLLRFEIDAKVYSYNSVKYAKLSDKDRRGIVVADDRHAGGNIYLRKETGKPIDGRFLVFKQ